MENKRFLKIYKVWLGGDEQRFEACMLPMDERGVSNHYDMMDVSDDTDSKIFYLADDMTLQAVTLGKQERINTDEESPLHYAASDLIAGGKVVGSVSFTDH